MEGKEFSVPTDEPGRVRLASCTVASWALSGHRTSAWTLGHSRVTMPKETGAGVLPGQAFVHPDPAGSCPCDLAQEPGM